MVSAEELQAWAARVGKEICVTFPEGETQEGKITEVTGGKVFCGSPRGAFCFRLVDIDCVANWRGTILIQLKAGAA